VAYDQGYREGVTLGERDGRAGRNYDYQRHGVYRNPSGNWGYGSGNDQREAFRRGFAEGYRGGYARYSRGGYGQGQYERNYPTYPGSPGGRYGGYGYGGYGYNNQAYDRGFKDGYDEGRKAGRGNDRYEPYREKDYRKGDNGYNRRYGSRDAYERVYRDAFLAGYDRGYGEGRYSNNSRGWPW
jgi:hypothetical protein